MGDMAHLKNINVNPRGGVPKLPVAEARIVEVGVVGDKQRDRRYHGGPQRAVCLYSVERIEALRAEGHPIEAGTTGENLTIEGLDWQFITPGTRLEIGDVILEITSYTAPCKHIIASFANGEFTRMGQKQHPGWSRVYARVLKEGRVQLKDSVYVSEEPLS